MWNLFEMKNLSFEISISHIYVLKLKSKFFPSQKQNNWGESWQWIFCNILLIYIFFYKCQHFQTQWTHSFEMRELYEVHRGTRISTIVKMLKRISLHECWSTGTFKWSLMQCNFIQIPFKTKWYHFWDRYKMPRCRVDAINETNLNHAIIFFRR